MTENQKAKADNNIPRGFIKMFSRANTFVYKVTAGRVWGTNRGSDVCLLTMTGARSGKQKTIPVMYVPYNDCVILVASLGGAPKNPVWYYNLIANPDIEIQYRSNKKKFRARQVSVEEKRKLWDICVRCYPDYENYQQQTDREIPVFLCEPA